MSNEADEALIYLTKLTNDQLIQLSHEICQPILPEDALARQVIKDIAGDVGPMIFVHVLGLAIPLAVSLANRLELCMDW